MYTPYTQLNACTTRGMTVARRPPNNNAFTGTITTTVIEVRAPDAPATLYRLSHALTHLGLDVRSAVVATLGHEVVDVFYVKTPKSPDGRIAVGDFEQVAAALKTALAG